MSLIKTIFFSFLFVAFLCNSQSLFAQTKLKLEKITITGNKRIPQKTLFTIMKSKQGDKFNARFMKLDKVLITNYYQLQGYLNVFVDYNFRKEGENIFIDYTVNEGKRYILKSITLTGNEQYKDIHLRRRIPMEDGKPFQRSGVEQGVNAIELFYANNGKPYVIITPKQEVVEDSLVNLTITIEEGITVSIIDWKYDGLERVKGFLIRREMAFKKGDLFSREKIDQSQRNVYSTGLFDYVNYRLEPDNEDGSEVILYWQVKEKKAIWLGLRFGIGNEQTSQNGSQTTFDFTAEGGHRNIAGTARSVSLSIVPSIIYGRREQTDASRRLLNPSNKYTFTFVEPWVLNTRTPGILQISWSQEDKPISTVPLTSFNSSFNISHEYANNWSYRAGIAFQRVQLRENTNIDSLTTEEFESIISGGQDLIYSVSFIPVKDKRDNLFNPKRGYLTEFSNKIAYTSSRPIIGGQASDTLITNQFYKFNFQWNRYQKFALVKNWVFATRARIGGLVEMGKTQPIQFIPRTERFFVGGANTIRGYPEQFVGGVLSYTTSTGETEQEPIGGKYLTLFNAELRIPIIWLFQGEIFFDSGNVYESFDDVKSFSLRSGVGAGIAVITPFGPIRFDYGFKLFPREGEKKGNFHIGIAFAF